MQVEFDPVLIPLNKGGYFLCITAFEKSIINGIEPVKQANLLRRFAAVGRAGRVLGNFAGLSVRFRALSVFITIRLHL